jgi:hypothetical protein
LNDSDLLFLIDFRYKIIHKRNILIVLIITTLRNLGNIIFPGIGVPLYLDHMTTSHVE